MHRFEELMDRSVIFALGNLGKLESQTLSELQLKSETRLVKTLQMIKMQKIIIAVGVFSIFEASLQDRLGCKDGFVEVRKILQASDERELDERFAKYLAAINILKHGKGRSYEFVLSQSDDLPFRFRRPQEDFFCEGDVSELSWLVDVDDSFIKDCTEIIRVVSEKVLNN